jgi:hypothetical protein
MPYPDEYNTWRCDNPEKEHPGKDCEAVWQHCDSCWDDTTGDYPHTDCDDCSGSHGGHVCLHFLDNQQNNGD